MRKLATLAIILLIYIGYGIFMSQYDYLILTEELHPENPPGYHDYRGSTHAHSTLSTGSGTPEEVMQGANEAGLDYLFLTDLNEFKLPPSLIGYADKVLTFRAGEYGYLDSRLLFYDVEKRRDLKSLGQAQVLFADLLSQKQKDPDEGLLVLAHPFKRNFGWSGSFPPGLDGIELINLKEVWEKSWQSSKFSFVWSVLTYPFNPRLALLRLYQDPKEEFDLLDTLQKSRPTIAIAGTDATARPIQILPSTTWYFPTYRTSFEIMSNHVLLESELTGDAKSDADKIFQALKRGQFFVSLDLLGNPRGFYAEMSTNKNHFPMGSKLKLQPDLKLVVKLPRKPRVPYEVAIFKDGNHYMSSNSEETVLAIHTPGVYRAVVRVIPTLPLPDGKRWFSWIYTNSFYVQ